MLSAAAERRLKFSAEILAIGMAEEEFSQRPRIGSDVEHFVLASSRKRAGGDVADGIAAGFARGDIGGGEAAHQAGSIVNLNVMKLDILPGGNVRDAVGVFLGEFRHGLQLIGVHSATGNFDALHAGRVPHSAGALSQVAGGIGNFLKFLAVVALAVVIALAVGAPAKACFGEQAFLDLALLAQRDFGFENVNFARQMLRHLASKFFGPQCVRSLHKLLVLNLSRLLTERFGVNSQRTGLRSFGI